MCFYTFEQRKERKKPVFIYSKCEISDHNEQSTEVLIPSAACVCSSDHIWKHFKSFNYFITIQESRMRFRACPLPFNSFVPRCFALFFWWKKKIYFLNMEFYHSVLTQLFWTCPLISSSEFNYLWVELLHWNLNFTFTP